MRDRAQNLLMIFSPFSNHNQQQQQHEDNKERELGVINLQRRLEVNDVQE